MKPGGQEQVKEPWTFCKGVHEEGVCVCGGGWARVK